MNRMPSVALTTVVSIAAAFVSGCPATQVVAPAPPRVDQADSQVAGCLVAKDPLNPFIVEWPGTEKVALEVASKEGLVAVSYVSCYLKVLRGCRGVGAYETREANAAVDGFEITNQSDLYARLPLGAASLQAELSSGNGLRLTYLATGQKVAKAPLQKLDGECASATHYVRAMTVGAYSLEAMSSGAAAAGGGVGGLGAGAGRKESLRRIRGQGNIEQCQITGLATKGCDAVLQLELAPVSASSPVASAPSFMPAPATPVATAQKPKTNEMGEIRPETGVLRIEGNPKGAKVEISGPKSFGEKGRATAALPFGPFEVPAGEYKIKVSAPDFDEHEAAARVFADRTEVVRADLAESFGTIEILGEPKGARVELACEKGFAKTFGLPGKLTVPRGSCAVKVSRDGYEAHNGVQQVSGGKTATVNVRLAKVTRPEVLTAGSRTSGKAGIEWVYSQPAKVNLARTETTVAQYRACVEAGRCTKPKDKSDNKYCNWGHGDRDAHPINCVHWNQATAFCEWAGGRLPTEDEWYAEAGNGGSRKYPWGDTEVTCNYAIWGDGSNTDGCGRDSTWPVCSKTAGNSVSGLCDMSGNVWEWTSSWYDSSQAARVLRGGSWSNDDPETLRASGRDWSDPTSWGDSSGFRCAGAAQ